MRGYKNPSVVANAVRMMRSAFSGSILLVEGESDSRFWRSRIDQERCRIEVGEGRSNVAGAMSQLDEARFRGAVGLLDADYERLEERREGSPNLIRTDTHDLETLLLKSPALEKVLAEFALPRKLDRFEQDQSQSVRGALLMRGLPLGRLRWLSQREGLRLRFSGLSFDKFVEEFRWEVDEERMLLAVLHLSQRPDSHLGRLQSMMAELPSADPWDICSGHDLVELLAIGLRRVLGSEAVRPDDLEQHLRLAFEASHLQATHVYREIRRWEEGHPPYRVVPD